LQKLNKQAYGSSFGLFILQYVAARQEKRPFKNGLFSIRYEGAILRIGMESTLAVAGKKRDLR
jgi:hypothetical protein